MEAKVQALIYEHSSEDVVSYTDGSVRHTHGSWINVVQVEGKTALILPSP